MLRHKIIWVEMLLKSINRFGCYNYVPAVVSSSFQRPVIFSIILWISNWTLYSVHVIILFPMTRLADVLCYFFFYYFALEVWFACLFYWTRVYNFPTKGLNVGRYGCKLCCFGTKNKFLIWAEPSSEMFKSYGTELHYCRLMYSD